MAMSRRIKHAFEHPLDHANINHSFHLEVILIRTRRIHRAEEHVTQQLNPKFDRIPTEIRRNIVGINDKAYILGEDVRIYDFLIEGIGGIETCAHH